MTALVAAQGCTVCTRRGDGVQIFQRDGKDPSHGGGMKIEGQQALQPSNAQQVRDQPRSHGFTPARPAVVVRITEIWHHRGQVDGTSPPAGLRQQEQFQQMHLHWRAGRLEEVDIAPGARFPGTPRAPHHPGSGAPERAPSRTLSVATTVCASGLLADPGTTIKP
jgi:hypothetical protein